MSANISSLGTPNSICAMISCAVLAATSANKRVEPTAESSVFECFVVMVASLVFAAVAHPERWPAMRVAVLVLVLLITPALSGCLYLGIGYATLNPHKEVAARSPEVSGIVLDEQTQAPVAGAKVFFTEHPHLSCKSEATGKFRIKETHTLYWGSVYGPGGGTDWPNKYDRWYPSLTASHKGYVSRQVDWNARQGDVILLRKSK